MAEEGRSVITDQINSTFPDNNQKKITAEMVRAFMDIINESKFNLVDDSLANIRTSTGQNPENLIRSVSYNSPLFYVQINWENTSNSATHQNVVNLTSFTSNNNTVNVTQSNAGGKTNIFTITYSETYNTSKQLVRKFDESLNTLNTNNASLIQLTNLALDTYPNTVASTTPFITGSGSVNFYSVYANNRPTSATYGGLGQGSFVLIFYNNDFTYLADL